MEEAKENDRPSKIEEATDFIKAHLFDQQIDILVCSTIIQSFCLNVMRKAERGQEIVDGLREQAKRAMDGLELSQMPPPNAGALRREAAVRVEQWFLDLERTAGLQPPPEKMS